ncbi:Deoxyhypusine synthase [Phaffia rhodozyma]|uniref:deoxyhypusine synthase n=1 Tax=Phaffia rhodozyma TaxID=264483 RepID=A0A0F7SW95_PHARH|nr:Deoxyhypusine synthase [Phaffia rhodozyma]
MASSTTGQAHGNVLLQSEPVPIESIPVQGPNFDKEHSLNDLLASYATMGFQGTSFAKACRIVDEMRSWRPEPSAESSEADTAEDSRPSTPEPNDPYRPPQDKAAIFLGYTSNLISSGLREIICYLAKHKMISALVTTAGGVEEDFIKCLGKTYLGQKGFEEVGRELRGKGMNRIGNLLVPNSNYCAFEDWVLPILDAMVVEQKTESITWAPSDVIRRLGKEINDESSVYYWCWKNDIPVFCPALTDGSLGDMLYFHSYKTETPLVIDIVKDIRRLNDMSVKAKKAGMIILGGGVCKHQIANAMLFRNGADYSVYINTGQEFDGSDSGARPDEAVSWGKIKADAPAVKVYADATLIFPLLVAQTFAKTKWNEDRTNGAL